MANETALPDIKGLWDFNDPVATRAKFRALIESERVEADPTYKLELATQFARTHSLVGEFEEADRLLDRVLEELDAAEPVVRVRYLLERGRTLNSARKGTNSRGAAAEMFIEAWECARGAGLDDLAIDAAHMLGIVCAPDEAIAWTKKALTLAETSGDPGAKNWLGALYNNLGWTYHDEGKHERALELFRKGLQWREEQGNPGPTRIAKWSVARALRSLQRGEEALALQLELEQECEAAGEADGFVYEELGELFHAAGDEEKARHYFARALPLLKEMSWVDSQRLARLEQLVGM